jgi:hypothetical protein
MYAFQATRVEDPEYQAQMDNKWDRGHTISTRDEDSKYKWKLKAPKDGEFTSKMVLSDGKRKK